MVFEGPAPTSTSTALRAEYEESEELTPTEQMQAIFQEDYMNPHIEASISRSQLRPGFDVNGRGAACSSYNGADPAWESVQRNPQPDPFPSPLPPGSPIPSPGPSPLPNPIPRPGPTPIPGPT